MSLTTQQKDQILIVIIVAILLGLFLRALFWVGIACVIVGFLWLVVNGKKEHPSKHWWVGLILLLLGILILRL